MSESPRYVDAAVVARRLGVTPQTVRNWIKRGQIPGERTPAGRFRIRLSTLIALVSADCAKSAKAPRAS